MIECFSVPNLIAIRSSQASFHVAAERHVRVEFRNMLAGDVMERFAYSGDVVLTCYRGEFAVGADAGEATLEELCMAVVPAETWTTIRCTVGGTLQVIWAPAHAETRKESGPRVA